MFVLTGGIDMNRTETYYRVEMTTGSGALADNYETYDEAYDALCTTYVKEKENGYVPTKYKIVRYDETFYEEYHNLISRLVWE